MGYYIKKGGDTIRNYTLTVLDTAGIQNYIFGSNNLKHNVGASGLVHCATHEWVFENLVKSGDTNVDLKGNFNTKTIESDNLKSELMYAGGGNALIIFNSIKLAKDFTKRLTIKALQEAPGLQLIVTHKEFDWDANNLTEIINKTMHDLNSKKFNRVYSTPLLGLGVTADCQYTGLPATNFEKKGDVYIRVSSETKAKSKFFPDADKRLKEITELREDYEFVREFDDFGTKNESSYISVIHTDGNAMGKRIQDIAEKHRNKENRQYIQSIRNFSTSVENASRIALQATVKLLESSTIESDGNFKIGKVVDIKINEKNKKKSSHFALSCLVVMMSLLFVMGDWD